MRFLIPPALVLLSLNGFSQKEQRVVTELVFEDTVRLELFDFHGEKVIEERCKEVDLSTLYEPANEHEVSAWSYYVRVNGKDQDWYITVDCR